MGYEKFQIAEFQIADTSAICGNPRHIRLPARLQIAESPITT
jgi:hypothetical protein